MIRKRAELPPPAEDPLVKLTRRVYAAEDQLAATSSLRDAVRHDVGTVNSGGRGSSRAALSKKYFGFWQRMGLRAAAACSVALILAVWSLLPNGSPQHSLGPAASVAGVTDEFQQALALYDQAALSLGDCRTKLLEQSSAEFVRIPQRYPEDRTYAAAAQLFLADCCAQLDRWPDAIQAYQTVLNRWPHDSAACRQARLALADGYLHHAHDFAQAVSQIEVLVKDQDAGPDAAPLCLALAMEAEAQDPKQAAQWYRRAAELAGEANPAIASQAQANLASLDQRLQQRAALKDWWIIGPFSNKDQLGLGQTYPPETEQRTSARYPGSNGEIGWQRPFQPKDFGPVDFADLLHTTDGTAYALTYVQSSADREAIVQLNTADAAKLWLNDEVVWQSPFETGPQDNVIHVQLLRGWNRLLLKSASVQAPWTFQLKVLDRDLHVISDLTSDPTRGGA